jgi:hypothetical protein
MHQLRSIAAQPGEQLLYTRPGRVAVAFTGQVPTEPDDERAQHRLVDLSHRDDVSIVRVEETEPDADAVKGPLSRRRRVAGMMVPECQRDLGCHLRTH